MKCPDCGSQNLDGAKCCTGCSKAIAAEKSTTYEFVADKVGLVPNVRGKDNRFQAIFVGISIVIGAIAGFIIARGTGVLLGVLAGLILGGFISGLILMVKNLVRK